MPNLAALLNARTIAVVGASNREGSFGWHLVRQLIDFGFDGKIIPVNPAATEIQGIPCFPSCAAIGKQVDCAAICVADERLETALTDVIAANIPAAVIFGTARGNASDGRPLVEWITEIARSSDLALQGPNCMGHFNFANRQLLTGYPYNREPREGSIGFITHSGSIFSAIVKNTRGLNFNLAISPGQERLLTAADYLEYILGLPTTNVVALVLEAIREPDRFMNALSVATRREIPIVLLKIGRTDHGAEMAMTHTGAIAGDQAAIEAIVARYNVCLVRTIEELLDTAELFAQGRRWEAGELAAVADSGGERTLMVDLASDRNLPWATLSPPTVDILAATLDEGPAPVNPVDLWGTGHDWQRVYRTSIAALLADETLGALSYGIDFNQGSRLNDDYAAIAIETCRSTAKPFAVVSNVAAGTDPDWASRLRKNGVPVLLGTDTGLAAFAHLRQWSRRQSATLRWQSATFDPETRGVSAVEPQDRPLTEIESYRVMKSDLYTPPAWRAIHSPGDLDRSGDHLDWPMVIKTAMPGIIHKSDVDGIYMRLNAMSDLRNAYERLSRDHGPEAMVQQMVVRPRGVELVISARVDPQFGALVSVGLGGIWIEVLRDLVTFLAPVISDEVIARLPELRAFTMLNGARGKNPVDLTHLSDIVVEMGTRMLAYQDQISSMEINPLLADGADFLMLDALVIPAGLVSPIPE